MLGRLMSAICRLAGPSGKSRRAQVIRTSDCQHLSDIADDAAKIGLEVKQRRDLHLRAQSQFESS
jgi:hypothetical protein